jgi:hypothetical protein
MDCYQPTLCNIPQQRDLNHTATILRCGTSHNSEISITRRRKPEVTQAIPYLRHFQLYFTLLVISSLTLCCKWNTLQSIILDRKPYVVNSQGVHFIVSPNMAAISHWEAPSTGNPEHSEASLSISQLELRGRRNYRFPILEVFLLDKVHVTVVVQTQQNGHSTVMDIYIYIYIYIRYATYIYMSRI